MGLTFQQQGKDSKEITDKCIICQVLISAIKKIGSMGDRIIENSLSTVKKYKNLRFYPNFRLD